MGAAQPVTAGVRRPVGHVEEPGGQGGAGVGTLDRVSTVQDIAAVPRIDPAALLGRVGLH
ncbi:hypothetical protein TPA0907_23850 [Micromonospora humidisoli]|nr:hypothetical protein TPA0907_23850 [Micromonospora sp. AKA109]